MTNFQTSKFRPYFNKQRGCLIDLSHRCSLQCSKCQRQIHFKDNKVVGDDLPMRTIEMILDKFTNISFGGQLSDPIHYPNFIKVLEMCKEKRNRVKVQTASSYKPESWFIKAFKAFPSAKWQFGLDGLPEESHKYRVNQDGPKIFRMMCEATKHLVYKPIWQYIVFNYNEDHIEEARELAKKNNLQFVLMKSARWFKNDPFMPSAKNRIEESVFD